MKKYIVDSGIIYTYYLEFEGEKVKKFNIEKKNEDPKVDDIYFGNVINILPNRGIAFIDIGRKKNAIIHLKDTLKFIKGECKNINAVLHEGKRVLVQVKKIEDREKGAKVSELISLSSNYFVYLPYEDFKGYSKKIIDNKKELKKIMDKNFADDGFICRTSSAKLSEDKIIKEFNDLKNNWLDILIKVNSLKKNALVYSVNSALEYIVNKFIDNDIDELVLNDKKIYDYILNKLKLYEINIDGRIKIAEKNQNIFTSMGVEFALKSLLNKKVPLIDGGNIIIEEGETLTAIDVNFSSALKKGNDITLSDFNLLAFTESLRQIKLRNISGIIIIDVINISDKNQELKFIKEVKKLCLKEDDVLFHGYSKLGLIEITRKNSGKSINELIVKKKNKYTIL